MKFLRRVKRLLGRRVIRPPAPCMHRLGADCGCNPKSHAIGWDAEIAVTAEWLLARLNRRRELADALAARLEPCPHRSDAEVTS